MKERVVMTVEDEDGNTIGSVKWPAEFVPAKPTILNEIVNVRAEPRSDSVDLHWSWA